MSIKRLQCGASVPAHKPKRYHFQGYILLRWKVGIRKYVEALKHRVVDGFIVGKAVTHHKNKIKSDNSKDNLVHVESQADHARLHRMIDRNRVKELYQSGLGTIAVAEALDTHAGNISRILKEELVATRYGKGVQSKNRKIVDDDLITKTLRSNNWNVLHTSRITGYPRHIIRRVQGEKHLPKHPPTKPKNNRK